MCYVSSDLLNHRVRPERDTFDIATYSEMLFEDTEISWSDIRNGVISSIATHLREHIEQVKDLVEDRVYEFVSNKSPRYKPVLHYIEADEMNIDPKISDNDLEIALHRKYAELEEGLISGGSALMKPQNGESTADYKTRIDSYLQKVEDVKRSDLANYVNHRRVIIDLLQSAVSQRADDSYEHEDLI